MVTWQKYPYPEPEWVRAPHVLPVQSQGERLLTKDVFLFWIIVGSGWLYFCMSQLWELGILDAIWIFTFSERSCIIGLGAKRDSKITSGVWKCLRERELGWLSLSTKIENVLITVHKYLHADKILNTAALFDLRKEQNKNHWLAIRARQIQIGKRHKFLRE